MKLQEKTPSFIFKQIYFLLGIYMKLLTLTCFISYFLLFTSVQARTIADVAVAERIQHENNTTLILNGAGIRKKFFFKIYITSLYLPQKQTKVAKILAKDEPRQIILNFIHSKVPKAKIVKAWNKGFEENLSSQEHQQLASKIATFNRMFGDLNEGDKVILSYTPNKGTDVIINNKNKGNIASWQFNNALLKIWIGNEPASDDLKESLLGID